MDRTRRRGRIDGAGYFAGLLLCAAVVLSGLVQLGLAQDQPPEGSVPNPAGTGFEPGGALGVLSDAAPKTDPNAAPAFAGLARELSVDPLTGAATTSIPIEVPPGRKGMTPALALTYSSNNGNGIYGVGWELQLGSIRRDTRHGVPSYPRPDDPVAAGDRFVLLFRGGTIVLDSVLGPSGSTITYGSSIEESALTVVLHNDTN